MCDRLLKQLHAPPGAPASGIDYQLADFRHRPLMMQLTLNANVDKTDDLVFIDKNIAAKRGAFELPCKTSVKCRAVKTSALELAQQLVNRRSIACGCRSNRHGNAPLCKQTLAIE